MPACRHLVRFRSFSVLKPVATIGTEQCSVNKLLVLIERYSCHSLNDSLFVISVLLKSTRIKQFDAQRWPLNDTPDDTLAVFYPVSKPVYYPR